MARSTWWIVTAFNEDIVKMEDPDNLPAWVKAIHGGREACPSTGKLHGQQAVQCHTQTRFGTIKSWLPKSHIEAARSALAIKTYCMKATTAAGEKKTIVNTKPFYTADGIMTLIAKAIVSKPPIPVSVGEGHYWQAVNKILETDPTLAGQLMNPSLRNFFLKTSTTWLKKGLESIVLPPASQPDPGLDGGSNPCVARDGRPCQRDECEVCAEYDLQDYIRHTEYNNGSEVSEEACEDDT